MTRFRNFSRSPGGDGGPTSCQPSPLWNVGVGLKVQIKNTTFERSLLACESVFIVFLRRAAEGINEAKIHDAPWLVALVDFMHAG